MLRVGRDRARAEQVDELAGDGRADDEQLLRRLFSTRRIHWPGSRWCVVGEGLVDDHLVLAAVGEVAAPNQHDVVEDRPGEEAGDWGLGIGDWE